MSVSHNLSPPNEPEDAFGRPEDVDFVYDQVFRATLDRPGFVSIPLAPGTDSRGLRRAMLALARQLSERHPEPLDLQWVLRFDQQITSRFHRDAALDESYLLLGYEPSLVVSEVAMADFSCAARDLGITPAEYVACTTRCSPQTPTGWGHT